MGHKYPVVRCLTAQRASNERMSLQTILFQSILNGVVLGCIYALMATGFTIVFSVLRVVNFAHGEFYMLGAYFTFFYFDWLGLPFPAALLLSALTIGLFGLLLEPLVFRPFAHDELSGMVAAIGLSAVLQSGASMLFGAAPYSMRAAPGSLRVGTLVLPLSKLLALGMSIAALSLCAWALFTTKIGRALRAIVQDREIAQAYGIRIGQSYLVGFACGVALAAFAGGVMAAIFPISPFMGTTPVLKAFVVVVLGGLGSLSGAVFAALLLGLVESLTSTFVGALVSDLAQLVLVLVVLLVRPHGLRGEVES